MSVQLLTDDNIISVQPVGDFTSSGKYARFALRIPKNATIVSHDRWANTPTRVSGGYICHASQQAS
jgi:hypothetical protein